MHLWLWSQHENYHIGSVWHCSASSLELFFLKITPWATSWAWERAMFLQLHRVLNSVRASFQRSWPESWPFGYWSCEAAREAAHEAVPNGPTCSPCQTYDSRLTWTILFLYMIVFILLYSNITPIFFQRAPAGYN
jgi:hypothetical protein